MTTSIYDEDAIDALAEIAAAGAPIIFLADDFRGGSIAADVTGSAFQDFPGDPDVYQTLSLIEKNPVTLWVAASGLGITPKPGVKFKWPAATGTKYTVRLATPLAPDGVPILWTIVGSA